MEQSEESERGDRGHGMIKGCEQFKVSKEMEQIMRSEKGGRR